MSAMYATYLSKEDREAARSEGKRIGIAEGEARGEAKGKAEGETMGLTMAWEIINLLKSNTPVPDIVAHLKVPTSEVERFKALL